ncbi:hypothetical protein [Actinorugispora endophytica]|uniref:DUF4034 domain-containing protein n=1 Tax=Actinorugispora endophytica TaxID=1605990 RepID=A0A4R6URJ8_9ACTN|nr:hypothetical protein [Actinorugispora endophytica]TDQ48223.1 hypothetical protein EV190_11937 [Actinorugispora endophytica]
MGQNGRGGAGETRDPDVESIVVGRCWNDPALDAGVDAVREGHLTAGLTLLGESRADPELRALYVGALGDAAVGRSGRIHALLTRDTAKEDAADILLWLGRTLIDEAWKIRGDGLARTVGQDRFKMFFAILARARDPLLAAAEIAPDDPVPWECLQWFALGLQLDREEKDRIWQHVVERCPTLYPAHWGRVQVLAAKWGGSHEEMLEFARGSVDLAPPGHPLTSMIALAHYERAAGVIGDLVDRKRFFSAVRAPARYYEGEVAAELRTAAHKWCAAPVAHPRDLEANHLFGWAFNNTSDKNRARWHLYQVGNRTHPLTWDDPKAFLNVLRGLGLA